MDIRQHTFNHIVNHLRKQGQKSTGLFKGAYGQIQGCMYRGPDGLMCAAGCCIRDEFYRADMEGRGAGWETVSNAITMSGFDVVVATSLQHIHDSWPIRDWEDSFNKVAEYYKLVYTPAEQL